MRKVLNIIGYVITALLVALVVFLLVNKMKGEPAFIGGYTMMWVQTNSMEEEIPAHSYILIQQIEGSDVREGDVITFYSDDPVLKGNLNTHRVMSVSEDGKEFVTKGDHNYIEDEYTAKAENVVGRYIKVLPAISYVGRLLTTKSGIFIVFAALMLLIILMVLPDFVKALKEEKQKKLESKQAEMQELIDKEVERLKKEAEATEKSDPENKN